MGRKNDAKGRYLNWYSNIGKWNEKYGLLKIFIRCLENPNSLERGTKYQRFEGKKLLECLKIKILLIKKN